MGKKSLKEKSQEKSPALLRLYLFGPFLYKKVSGKKPFTVENKEQRMLTIIFLETFLHRFMLSSPEGILSSYKKKQKKTEGIIMT